MVKLVYEGFSLLLVHFDLDVIFDVGGYATQQFVVLELIEAWVLVVFATRLEEIEPGMVKCFFRGESLVWVSL